MFTVVLLKSELLGCKVRNTKIYSYKIITVLVKYSFTYICSILWNYTVNYNINTEEVKKSKLLSAYDKKIIIFSSHDSPKAIIHYDIEYAT